MDAHDDLLSLHPAPLTRQPVSRRGFVRTSVGTGFAASVLPICAQTAIKTDAQGLLAGEVMIDVAGFRMPAYRAMPQGRTSLPLVLVLSEIFGVHEYIADTARRFAKAGYMAVAPELFVRQGDAQGFGTVAELIREVISKVPDAQVMADLDATIRWAAGNGADVNKVGVTGFCWGGRQTWLYAAHSPAIKAGVAWYGRLVGQATPLNPRHPVDVAGQLNGPVLGLYGGADDGIPLTTVEQMRAALAQAGMAPASRQQAAARASQFQVYPEAPHAFHADYRPTYREAAARDGWTRCLAWFRQHGVA